MQEKEKKTTHHKKRRHHPSGGYLRKIYINFHAERDRQSFAARGIRLGIKTSVTFRARRWRRAVLILKGGWRVHPGFTKNTARLHHPYQVSVAGYEAAAWTVCLDRKRIGRRLDPRSWAKKEAAAAGAQNKIHTQAPWLELCVGEPMRPLRNAAVHLCGGAFSSSVCGQIVFSRTGLKFSVFYSALVAERTVLNPQCVCTFADLLYWTSYPEITFLLSCQIDRFW